jgi:hypothetical protein
VRQALGGDPVLAVAISLATYLLAANQLSLGEFKEKYPHAVLVVEPYTMDDEPQLSTSAGGDFGGGIPMVYPIQNKAGHGFGDRVTIGRTGNNDVPIQAPDVSKYHGYLTRDGAEAGYTYTDADSTYGSKVNDEPSLPGVKVPLPFGAVLEIASVRMTIYSPPTFYEFLFANPGGPK